MKSNETDWAIVVVHALCGAILGAGTGASVWFWGFDAASVQSCLYCVVGGALVFGVLAGIYLDDFWEWIKENWVWPW